MTFQRITTSTPTGELAAFARRGEGRPIVLVHGVLADAEAWLPVAELLAPSRPLLLPNRRGRLPGPAVDDRYSVSSEVDDLRRWLSTLDQPVDLIGHSYGGLIATEAAHDGAGLRSLILYEPVSFPFGVDLLAAVDAANEAEEFDRVVEIINIGVSGYAPSHVAALRASKDWERLTALARPAAAELRQINSYTPRPFDTGQGIPVSLIAGELSRHRVPYGPNVDLYADVFRTQPTILRGHDHLAHITGPADLAGILNSLLDDPDA